MGNDELARLYKPQKVQPSVVEEVEPEKPVIKDEEQVIEETVVPIDKIDQVDELKKEEIEDEVQVTDIIPLDDVAPPLTPTVDPIIDIPPPEKKPKMEYFSENSASLPGVSEQGNQPVGFEPGMFGKGKGESTEEGDASKDKSKKKKKDKKKHKHKHKKHKDKDKEKHKDKDGEPSFQSL